MLTINMTASLKLISLKRVLSFFYPSNKDSWSGKRLKNAPLSARWHDSVCYLPTHLSFFPVLFSPSVAQIPRETWISLTQRNRKHLLRWEMWPRRIHGEAGGALYDFKGVNKWPQWNESMEICATVLIHVFVFQCVQSVHVMKMPSFKLPFT